ncbi:glycoside hydrolase family 3 N-terminal domain-containing protein [Paenarthrobacter nicotinovorans]|uniref:glycoside hydrolase family 3 N-terminal domain-containing protein n=1 Tax=Paenarthrobacter nicotinovorans TaxID=29320 RepID=UPI001667873B|nr:glycoside hydrolase family 3 N-terminal domain-containing protein [Paenarthrobacter nicotinovorans]MBP2393509.1 beta-glucosidase-like glycosyl hydrolase [Paenarthrobacter nicotinovorans]UKF00235.1 glycoside hydrolase family 3 C-terminal domain-containing protein [Paenarthrobacter nicotinovorans]UKF05017.1 glycoside hydrolase family 3 C-terminal domain-containing protein [Paenarthrobacter nicotinovorans]GGV32867.1 beta-glucosidase [Paenarthrobacter nicotinovorans]
MSTGAADQHALARVPASGIVEHLIREMTLEEKLAQLAGVWVNASTDGDSVAPLQSQMAGDDRSWDDIIADGLGQITRMYGTVPVEPAEGARRLAAAQEQIMAASRFGIPAQVHEECLAGLAAWKATAFPVPLAWGATFNPGLVKEMASRIGESMRSLGVHQGLAPVLDVVRDLRWGRVEETIGEDPYLVGTVATAYVQGLESTGIVSTLKHFVGYSASQAGRNHAPVSMGPRELADVMLPPFEMALRHGGARSVMHAYTDIDGVPAAANRALLTGLLRQEWGFNGTVVADYFGVAFLDVTHGVAADSGEAAILALSAGVDVELPTVNCFGAPLLARVQEGALDVAVVDQALRRVLTQKAQVGLLSPDFSPAPPALSAAVDLDRAEDRALARELAAQSLVLLSNGSFDGAPALPLPSGGSLGVVGPLADDPFAMLGCYSFDAHVGASHPDVPMGISVPSVAAVAAGRFDSVLSSVTGNCEVATETEIAEACQIAASVDTCVVVVGDNAGLFGRGTSGEGNDAADLHLPGDQHRMLDRVLAACADSGSRAVVVVLSGRPYALGDFVDRADAIVQGFFPGEAGGEALWDVLTGVVNPSGKLPVSVPRSSGGQPGTYLHSRLAGRTEVSALDPSPLYGFGHGLSYTSFELSGHQSSAPAMSTSDSVTVSCTVTNTGFRDGAEVVQLYLEDPVGEVVRPVRELIGYARVELPAGASSEVEFVVHADRTSFTGLDLQRVVTPGLVKLHVSTSCASDAATHEVILHGPRRVVGFEREMLTPVRVRATA